ncbi:MAG: nitroreductase [Dehalococcoidales bacterium]|nr:nitroreductase [Dehalococcoidales bacterium]
MEVNQAILERYSARDFKPDPVDRPTLEKILETALRSPSSGNGQPWQIFVACGAVTEKITREYLERFAADVPGKPEMSGLTPDQQPQAMRDRMKQITNDRLKLLGINAQDSVAMKGYREIGGRLFRAPVLVILCMDKDLNTWSVLDIGLIAQSIMLAARGAGVDSIIAQSFVSQPDILRRELEIPPGLKIVTGIGLGYQNPESIINTYRSPRRTLQEAVTFKGI